MAYQFGKLTVLVVEDNLAMSEITKSLLLALGIGEVVCATDGESGFKKFQQENPDIILADWMMKPMNGIDFTKRVRNDIASPNPYIQIGRAHV